MILRYFLLLLLLIHPPAFAASRVALVIGNSGYEQNHDLDGNPLRDADTMAAVLKKVGFSVILKKDLNLSDMEDAVKSFGEQLDENTVALFYFSGHGVQRDGENYLIPLGAIRSIAAPGHLRDKTVNVNYVLSVMENAKSAVNLVFLDACRDNPFKGLFKGNATVGLATPKETPSGTLIAYATKAGGKSWTGVKGDNSPFVKVLVQEMVKPGVSITEMLTQVRSGVMKATDGEQAPAYYNELNGTFCFVEPCGQTTQLSQAEIALPSLTQPDKRFDSSIEKSKTGSNHIVEMLQAAQNRSFERLEQLTKEIQQLPKPVAKNSKFARELNQKAIQFLQQGNILLAIETLHTAYENNPADVEIVNNLGYAYTQHPEKSMRKQAKELLFSALELVPTRSAAWGNLGDFYAQEHQDVVLAESCFVNTLYFSRNRSHTVDFLKQTAEQRNDVYKKAVELTLLNFAK